MSFTDNINGIPAQDTVLRQGIATLRNTVISNTIKPLTVDHNGVYTANPNNGTYGYSPVTVDTGVYTGATAPDDSIGKDGDHYYQISKTRYGMKSVNSDYLTSSPMRILANEFYVTSPFKLTGIRINLIAAVNVKYYVLDNTKTVIYESDSIQGAVGWNEHTLTTPITLVANQNYIIAANVQDKGTYTQNNYTTWNTEYVIFVRDLYSASDNIGGLVNDSVTCMVDPVLETDVEYVIAEYIKDDSWVSISGSPKMILSTLNATDNGTYTAPTGTAYSSVSVNVGPEIILRSDWNALTTAQKQAKGLVVIQDSSSGFLRGEYINGADYHDTLLQYSVYDNILEEDKSSNHESGTSVWGGLTLGGTMDNDADGAVITDGKAVSFDLSAANTSVTIYALMKRHGNTESGNRTLVGVPYTMSGGNLPNIFCNGTTVNTSVYGSDDAISGISSTNYVLYTMAIDAVSKKVDFYANGVLKRRSVSFSNSGGHVVFGAAETDLTNAISCNIKYIGIVDGYENDNVIMNNHSVIMDEYDL